MGNTSSGLSYDADIVVVGAGPTGLGAAYRLHQYRVEKWLLIDAEKGPGGLAGSFTTNEGFRFDHGFQVLTSNYDYFDKVLDSLQSKSKLLLHEVKTISAVLSQDHLIPYPIQDNLTSLPSAQRLVCAADLMTARLRKSLDAVAGPVNNLNDYLVREWGEGLSNLFFRPYIYKSWAYPPEKMTHEWISRRIPDVDVARQMERLLQNQTKNNHKETIVKYPNNDGLAKVWKVVVDCLSEERVHFKTKIKTIDVNEKKITTNQGAEIRYEHLVSTIPLALLLRLVGKSEWSSQFESSSSYVVCLGMRGFAPYPKITGCIYFPESNVVFHRACVFSSFDRDSVPAPSKQLPTIRLAKQDRTDFDPQTSRPGPYWSLMLEVTCGPLKKVNKETIVADAINDACSIKLLKDNDELVSMHLIEMRQSCPLPKVNGQKKVKETLEWLRSKDILSRGKCGAFSQVVAGIDDDFIQGVEAVDCILHGSPEHCLNGDFCSGGGGGGGGKFCMPKYHLKRHRGSDERAYDESDLSSTTSVTSSASLFSDVEDTTSESEECSERGGRGRPATDSGLESREEA